MGITKTELPGGLVGELESANYKGGTYLVTGPKYTNLQESDDYAFGGSLKEAQVNYWVKKIADTEPLLIEDTKKDAELGLQVKKLREDWEMANEELLAASRNAEAELYSTENALKAAAANLFALTGEKEPGEYVLVKEKDGGLTYEKKAAIEWCRDNMKAAIVEELNMKAFESYAKDAELDFVTKNERQPQAQIARKKVEDAVSKT